MPSQYSNVLMLFKKMKCENSSAGRARPCQGRGRGFEPRFSLYTKQNYI
ncbi:hypothetical protein KU06062659_1460006 [Flavobacterium psychrophilum]|nr:hypothetical protein KU06062659_1460006 [Flavobacterium psychrophilum]SNB11783.1 hypothetical protein KU06112801_240001 [Flavobacterium psychrophilum]SNB95383.1 hypothetical protein FPC840_1330002 [Flavobacterium psychrophilum]